MAPRGGIQFPSHISGLPGLSWPLWLCTAGPATHSSFPFLCLESFFQGEKSKHRSYSSWCLGKRGQDKSPRASWQGPARTPALALKLTLTPPMGSHDPSRARLPGKPGLKMVNHSGGEIAYKILSPKQRVLYRVVKRAFKSTAHSGGFMGLSPASHLYLSLVFIGPPARAPWILELPGGSWCRE